MEEKEISLIGNRPKGIHPRITEQSDLIVWMADKKYVPVYLKNKEIVYVADETRDIEAAKKAKVRIISVTWGFNSREILKKQNPDFLVDRPEEILRIIDDERYET